VSWREGDDEVGWAPLPPDSDLGVDYYGDNADWDYGYHIGDDCDLAYGIGPWWYNFCPIVYIGDYDCWHHFHHRGDNFGLIGRTRNVTNLNFVRNSAGGRFGHVTDRGPSVAALNARAQTPIQTLRLARASTPASAGQRDDTLSVFAPMVDPATRTMARPDVVSRTVMNATVNHGTDINRGLAVNSRLAAPAATAGQIRAADAARTTELAHARVATDSTHFTRTFNGSLNSLRTEPRANAAFNAGEARTRSVRTYDTDSRFTAGAETPRVINPARDASAFSGGSVPRVYTPARTTRVYPDHPAASEFRSYRSEPSHSYRSYAPSYHYSYTPSYHAYGGASFHSYSAPHFSGGGGFTHASSGGFSGGGHVSGGFSGGGRR
jgi:uncharacterized membrane protein YgcG